VPPIPPVYKQAAYPPLPHVCLGVLVIIEQTWHYNGSLRAHVNVRCVTSQRLSSYTHIVTPARATLAQARVRAFDVAPQRFTASACTWTRNVKRRVDGSCERNHHAPTYRGSCEAHVNVRCATSQRLSSYTHIVTPARATLARARLRASNVAC
jgi:hypothetical protein